MPESPNGQRPRRKPGTSPRQISNPNEFCIFCCQLFKQGKQENIKPMVTRTVIFVNNMPVAVPTCIDHLEAPSSSLLAP